MSKEKCVGCKVMAALVIVGALNWGLIGAFDLNLVDRLFGMGTLVSRIIYGLVGLSGLILLVSCIKKCPGCCKTEKS